MKWKKMLATICVFQVFMSFSVLAEPTNLSEPESDNMQLPPKENFNGVELFKALNCDRRKFMCWFYMNPKQRYNFKGYGPCNNDDAKSILIGDNVKRGSAIIMTDDPRGRSTDDWVSIYVNQDLNKSVCVSGFEVSRTLSGKVRVNWHPVDDHKLDGKVSYIGIYPPGSYKVDLELTDDPTLGEGELKED